MKALLVTELNSNSKSLHTWVQFDEQQNAVFESMEQSVEIDGKRIETVNGSMSGQPDIKQAAVYEHETFFDAVRSVGGNNFRALNVQERSQHYAMLASVVMLANASKARRRGCAALIVRKSSASRTKGVAYAIASGVNGTAAGKENLCEDHLLTASNPGVLHAEVNALNNLCGPTGSTDVMYVTDSPCPFCLEHLRNYSAIRTIVFCRDYRITDHMAAANDFKFIYIPQSEVEEYIQSSLNRLHNFQTN